MEKRGWGSGFWGWGAVLLLLYVLLPTTASAQSTTDTLRLSDLFTTQPGSGGYVPMQERFDLRGPVIVFPDTGAWRLPPPTPEPTPTPAVSIEVDLPRLPMLIVQSESQPREVSQPAFISRGRSLQEVPAGHALVRFVSGLTTLRAQYTLRREDDPSAAPLVFLHGPATTESFAVPAGPYRLDARYWDPATPSKTRLHRHTPMQLDNRTIYEFNLTPVREQEIIQGMR